MIFLHFIMGKDSHVLRIETLFGVVLTNESKHPCSGKFSVADLIFAGAGAASTFRDFLRRAGVNLKTPHIDSTLFNHQAGDTAVDILQFEGEFSLQPQTD
jgi:hypothetical protein